MIEKNNPTNVLYIIEMKIYLGYILKINSNCEKKNIPLMIPKE